MPNMKDENLSWIRFQEDHCSKPPSNPPPPRPATWFLELLRYGSLNLKKKWIFAVFSSSHLFLSEVPHFLTHTKIKNKKAIKNYTAAPLS